MRHQRHTRKNPLDLGDDIVVDLLGELPADRRLKGTEMTVHAQAGQQRHFLFEYRVPRALEMVARRSAVFDIAQSCGQPELDRRVHVAVELGEHEETAAEEFAELRFRRDRIWEYHPKKGHGASCCHCRQLVRAEEIDWVVWLAVGFGFSDADFPHLEFVADGHVEGDDCDDGWAEVLGYFDVEIVLIALF